MGIPIYKQVRSLTKFKLSITYSFIVKNTNMFINIAYSSKNVGQKSIWSLNSILPEPPKRGFSRIQVLEIVHNPLSVLYWKLT